MHSTGCTLFWVSLLFFGSVCPEKLPMHIMCPCYPVGGQQSLLPFILVLLCPALAICALFILSPMLVLQISTPIWAKRIKFISKSRINTSQRGFYHQVEKSPHLINKCLLSSVKFTKRFEWRLSCTEEALMHWGFAIRKTETEPKFKNVKLLWRTEEFSPVWKHSMEMAACNTFTVSHLEKHSCCNLQGLQSGNAKRSWIIEVLPSSPKR